MRIGMIGLGKMGADMTVRAQRPGVGVGFDEIAPVAVDSGEGRWTARDQFSGYAVTVEGAGQGMRTETPTA